MNTTSIDLSSKKCAPCEGGVDPLPENQVSILLSQLTGWESKYSQVIEKTYQFKNHYQTIAFVNAIAWISHREDHHPDLTVGYNHCRVEYTTHAINGLSINDFICATKVDQLFEI